MPAPSNQNPSNISPTIGDEVAFSEVVRLIAASREKAIQAVNTALINPLLADRGRRSAAR
jgi:hypothetical protein